MSAKEIVHQWIDSLPEDCPDFRDLYEQARLERAISEAEADVAAGRVSTIEEVRARFAEKCRQRRIA